MSERPHGSRVGDHAAGGRVGKLAPGTMNRSHRQVAYVGGEIMTKTTISVIVVMVVGLVGVTEQSLAAEPLLEIDVNDKAEILDVRDKSGTLKPVPVQNIPIEVDGLRLMSAQSLIFAEVVSKMDDTVAWCCPKSGTNVPCAAEMRYSIDDTGEVTRVQARVADRWVDTEEELHVHAPAEIRSLKSHAVAVFEDKDGNRYGMVMSGMIISPDGGSGTELSMWFNPEKF